MSQVKSANNTCSPLLPFLIPTTLLLVGLGIALLTTEKDVLHLALCQPHSKIGDCLMPILSNLVDWLPYLVVVLLLFYKAGWAIFLASNLLLTTLVVQPIKHIVYAPRPLVWFAEHMPDVTLPIVEGVKMNHWLSFPSGHTTTFFAMFFTLSIILCVENVRCKHSLSVFLFILASLGGYTRIYLSQHFALDVFGGILIGIFCTLILYVFYVGKAKNSRFWAWKVQKLKK
jgi:membrane-associated phospholipid phosphatase